MLFEPIQGSARHYFSGDLQEPLENEKACREDLVDAAFRNAIVELKGIVQTITCEDIPWINVEALRGRYTPQCVMQVRRSELVVAALSTASRDIESPMLGETLE